MARHIGEDGQVHDDNPLPFLFGIIFVVLIMINLIATGLLGFAYGATACVVNFLVSALIAGALSIHIVMRLNRPKVEKPPRPCRNCGAPIPSTMRECPKCGRKRFF